MRKGLVIGGMVLGLLMGCNNGAIAELEKKSTFYESVANLGKGFLSIFTDLGDMVTGAFGIKADTKKDDIGKYFTKIATTMESVKKKLQDEVAKNGNYEKVKTVVDKFIEDKLDKIAEGAKEAAKGAKGSAIGNAVKSQDAAPAKVESVNLLVKGIKAIVEVVLKGQSNAEISKTHNNQQKTIGKLLGNNGTDGTEQQAAAASASIGAVSGADILKAISKSGDATSKAINQVTNAAEIAVATKDSQDFKVELKDDAVIAAGIALRAMAEDGKFVGNNTNSDEKNVNSVNGVVASAVNKTLSTLIIAIRNTVDSGLKTINDALAAVKQEDMSAETSEGVDK